MSAPLLAATIVDELRRGGVREAVLCPGSRNAPLAIALHDADVRGALRLHVRIDERSAAFLALGLALRSGSPVPVVCTSGSAAANLHPAMLEATHAGVALIAITADRPAELVGTGANQTIAQVGLYGPAVRTLSMDSGPEPAVGRWRSTVCRALAAAVGVHGAPGPVQLNVALREPLVGPAEVPAGRRDDAPWTSTAAPASARPITVDVSVPTLVIAGHGAGVAPAGVPVVAEPTAACWPDALVAGPWVLGAPNAPRPEQLLVLGRPTLHRSVTRLLGSGVPVHVVTSAPGWPDVAGTAVAVGTACHVVGEPDPVWAARWRDLDAAADDAVTAGLAATTDEPTGLHVAHALVATLPLGSSLLLGASNPIRDVALAARPRHGLTVLSSRGVSGIDGAVSTAVGIALAHDGPCYALLGDLTALHDANGLLIGPDEPRPDLTIVVANDDGGGIFGLLEQGAPEHAAAFERVFGTRHGTDLAALCAAHGVGHQLVGLADLPAALAPTSGLRMVEVRTHRRGLRDLHAELRRASHGGMSRL